ncbi:hypothetical protein PPL_07293 [Heterostelium album PN500]|uniref:Ankyrin repeat protein n=1 Tax=Heterostelium pallidum (strain ATCC 26659 / Pp 5 / PN500) TaxID=670386 RepID=D3BEX7_HETP5|nr:hypothetical protein PPL_07293 [Heterostelium album PN500]EFA80458.1 hypothetical protein PPL_07293 [Heterostelium album PN500]|eukprot:XP_020432578.1 hypothetical protein PPL_07293 [Heterostelium album PN500]
MKSELFKNIFNNIFIRSNIFNQLQNQSYGPRYERFKWIQLVNSPILLIQYDYFDLFVQHWVTVGCSNYHYKQMKLKDNLDIFNEAIRCNRLNFIKCFVELNLFDLPKYSAEVIYMAMTERKREIADYLVLTSKSDFICNYSPLDLIDACISNDIETVKLLSPKVNNDHYYEANSPLFQAALNGNLEILEWLLDHRFDEANLLGRTRLIGMTFNEGQIHVPDWLLSKGYIFDIEYQFSELNIDFTVNLYQWLSTTKLNIIFSSQDIDFAAQTSSLDTIKWISNHSKEECTEMAMYKAITHTNFEVAKWLHENYTVGAFEIDYIVSEDEKIALEMVKWFHENRTEGFSSNVMDSVASISLDIVKFLHFNRTEGCSELAMLNAIKAGHTDTFEFLKENRTEGAPNDLIEQLCADGNLAMIQYLHKTGKPDEYQWPQDAFESAARNSHLDLIKWIHQNTSHRCSNESFNWALLNGDFEMVQYLINNKLCSNDLESIMISHISSHYSKIAVSDWLLKQNIFDHAKLIECANQNYEELIGAFFKDYNIFITDI